MIDRYSNAEECVGTQDFWKGFVFAMLFNGVTYLVMALIFHWVIL